MVLKIEIPQAIETEEIYINLGDYIGGIGERRQVMINVGETVDLSKLYRSGDYVVDYLPVESCESFKRRGTTRARRRIAQ